MHLHSSPSGDDLMVAGGARRASDETRIVTIPPPRSQREGPGSEEQRTSGMNNLLRAELNAMGSSCYRLQFVCASPIRASRWDLVSTISYNPGLRSSATRPWATIRVIPNGIWVEADVKYFSSQRIKARVRSTSCCLHQIR
jgi:hypothetical protein